MKEKGAGLCINDSVGINDKTTPCSVLVQKLLPDGFLDYVGWTPYPREYIFQATLLLVTSVHVLY